MKLYFRIYHNSQIQVNNQLVDYFGYTVDNIIKTILEQITLQKKNEKEIEEVIIEIQCHGGSSVHGLKIYNFLKTIGLNVTTIGNTNVDSAAVMLFCAGNKRLSFNPTKFLIHQARSSVMLNNFGTEQILEQHNILKSLNDSYINVLNNMIKLSEGQDDNFNTLYERVYSGCIFNQDEALKNGLVTEVITGKYINDDKDVLYFDYI